MEATKCTLIVFFIISILTLSTCSPGSSSTKVKNHKQGRNSLSRDIKIDEIVVDNNKKVEEKKNSSSLMSLLISEKWMTPRFTHQLTDAFNSIGFPATVIVGVGFLVLLPIYLLAAGFSWLPLNKVSNPQDEPDLSNYYYKSPAPAPEVYYGSAASAPHQTHTIMYNYPPVAAPAPVKQYNYQPVPVPSTNYGYNVQPAPAPAPVQMHYSYPETPSNHYGYSQSMSDPSPSINYQYQPAIVSAPAPSSQYGPPSSNQIDSTGKSASVTSGEEVKVSSRKERSIKYKSDEQCVQRLACELAHATKGFKLPNWMSTVSSMLRWKDSNLIQESRKLLDSDCSHFQCDSYEIVKGGL